MNPTTQKNLAKLMELLRVSSRIVVFTGAGISTESGISDYRSKGGLWDRFHPVTIQEFLSSESKRREYWRYKKDLYRSMEKAQPNKGHLAIAQLDKIGKLIGVVTQNIDELHQMAGLPSAKVLELHGTNRKTVCLNCKKETLWEDTYQRLKQGVEIPTCLQCGGLLKPATISFGENLNSSVLNQAYSWVQQCDLLLAVGSTLVVEPAASLPRLAKNNGAKLIIINLSETPLDEMADLIIHDGAGEILSETVKLLPQGKQQ